MICPHCGKEIVKSAYTEPVNAACCPNPSSLFIPIVTNGNSQLPWISTVCAAGAAVAPPVTFHYTIGNNDQR